MSSGSPNAKSGADERHKNWEYDAPEGDGAEYLEAEPFSDSAPVPEKKISPVNASVDNADPYDFDSCSPQNRVARMDEERAIRVMRRRTEVNVFQRYFGYVVPYGGLLSSGINLASSCIGAGIIALPSAFNASGIIMALIYMVVIAYLTIYSYVLLAIVAKKTGLRNYEQIVRTLMGPGADYFLAFCLWFMSFGAEVSYAISLKDVLTAFLENSPSAPHFLRTLPGERVMTFVLWLVFMLPLCLPKEINTLRYFSSIAIAFVVYFAITMVIHSGMNGLQEKPRPEIIYFNTGNTAIVGLSTFLFAFISQLNAMEVAGEMYQFSVKRMSIASTIGVMICFTLYFFAGVFGYLDFGPKVTGSALKMYNPIKDKMMGVGYGGLMLKLCVGYGLHMIPVRDAIYHVFHTDVHHISWWKNACVCGSMASLSMICSLFVPNINVVFGLVGGFSGGFIGYIYPALMYMYSGNWTFSSVGWFHYVSTYVLLITGVIAVVWGTAAAIYGEVMAH
ncbi:putative amino acid transporter aATP11 [Leptomonas pyrrhocoris]|uniref:Putative amino acid transporter aATP11 n=1 Tax=Leptomonas pyrrhocoris TaxID=157538 RepID=A0A0N0DRC9_LEPPY|nr:putative amino acid transporter aATP11 [Leptomonas pyrrhocoris]KPA73954.1 putative amino acid transporter aATP11 [Leptomonas pyrrhocoris]|eukprot:XP_015652393.1 putative amino acid transporter aATP11 [Leptomonas pyrrhocoris]